MKHNKIFGKTIKRLRSDHKLSQQDFGYECEISRTYISLMELGQRSPTLDSLSKISFGLKMELSDFLVLLAEEIRHEKSDKK